VFVVLFLEEVIKWFFSCGLEKISTKKFIKDHKKFPRTQARAICRNLLLLKKKNLFQIAREK